MSIVYIRGCAQHNQASMPCTYQCDFDDTKFDEDKLIPWHFRIKDGLIQIRQTPSTDKTFYHYTATWLNGHVVYGAGGKHYVDWTRNEPCIDYNCHTAKVNNEEWDTSSDPLHGKCTKCDKYVIMYNNSFAESTCPGVKEIGS